MQVNPDLVRRARLSRAWTQQHLAEAMQVSPRTVQRIETHGRASLDNAQALCAVLELDRDALLSVPPPAPQRPLPIGWMLIGVFVAGLGPV